MAAGGGHVQNVKAMERQPCSRNMFVKRFFYNLARVKRHKKVATKMGIHLRIGHLPSPSMDENPKRQKA